MTRPTLAIDNTASLSARITRLQAEARSLAREHVNDLMRQLLALETTAAEIAKGGDAYPAGIRDLARHIANDAEAKGLTLSALNGRAS